MVPLMLHRNDVAIDDREMIVFAQYFQAMHK
jgi:hypothetical protein